ncbi:hypothetical protein AVEN_181254-1, partial [Araneus ventricosus]
FGPVPSKTSQPWLTAPPLLRPAQPAGLLRQACQPWLKAPPLLRLGSPG